MVYFAEGLAPSGEGFTKAVFGFCGLEGLAVSFGSGEDRVLDPERISL